MTPLLAHGGAGASWQAAVVVTGVVLAVCVLLVVLGRLPMSGGRDLLVPVAAAGVMASVAPLGSSTLSDGIGWGLPLAVVCLLVLVLGALTPLELSSTAPLTLGGLALAGVSIYLLHAPLVVALHPPPEELPLADDAQVTIVSPGDGARVDAGRVEVTVEVVGGSIGPAFTPLEELGSDPEEAGALAVYVDSERRTVSWDESCTVDAPCDSVDVEVDLAGGEHQLTVEFLRGDGNPFAPLVLDRVSLEAG